MEPGLSSGEATVHQIAEHIQRARSGLHLTVGEIADRSRLPMSTVWALVESSVSDVPRLSRHEARRLLHVLEHPPALAHLLGVTEPLPPAHGEAAAVRAGRQQARGGAGGPGTGCPPARRPR